MINQPYLIGVFFLAVTGRVKKKKGKKKGTVFNREDLQIEVEVERFLKVDIIATARKTVNQMTNVELKVQFYPLH